jgi:hypothetical protein
MVTACQNVTVLFERARKQVAHGRPSTVLDALDKASTYLNALMSSLISGASTSKNTMSLEEYLFGHLAMV